jgi:squalene synthase HpnC
MSAHPDPLESLEVDTADLPSDEVVLAKHVGENFPVALWVLTPRLRRHLFALYAFARLVDDVGDEWEGDREAGLDAIDRELDRIASGEAPRHPSLVRLAGTVHACDLPIDPLRRLVEANRIDQRVTRYETFEDLVGYCTYSADPIGRLVLQVFGCATPDRIALSDATCTALQIAEHLQDVAEDLAAGRIYLPLEDLRRFGVDEGDLRAPRASDAFRALMAFEVGRTREWFGRGATLVGSLSGFARIAVAGFTAGGVAALDAIDAAGGEVLADTPRPRNRVWLRRWLSLLFAGRIR